MRHFNFENIEEKTIEIEWSLIGNRTLAPKYITKKSQEFDCKMFRFTVKFAV